MSANPDLVSSGALKRRLSERAGVPILILLVCGLSTCLHAQEVPGAQAQASAALDAVQPPSLASITGTVRDAHGEAVLGASITVVGQDIAFSRVLAADSQGAFTLGDLSPGNYKVTIDTTGNNEHLVLVDVALAARETRDLPVIGAHVATISTTVHVEANPGEVAEAQLKQQEKQRLLGIVPNFFTSYIWDAAPMNSKQKFKLTFRSNTDPINFLLVATLAGVEQKHNTFPGYGQGAEGYAKRFGAVYADTMISKMVSRATLPSVFHQDPRYFYQGSDGVRSRMIHALTSAIICRGDNGRLQPNYSQVLGSFAATGIANLYRAPGDRTTSLTFRNGLMMTAATAVENLMREFVSRKLTPNVPGFANGKP
ncbi:MAG: carboxypeptidase-like regulatory domain-containing protein [Bryobacteraceae bacterium]